MAIHWKIPFKSLRTDTLYTVNIYDDSYTGSPVQLTGAAEPFVTQEDDSDDMFIPVRTQTGYIRIVDNGKDANGRTLATADRWDKMLPATNKSRKVALTNGSGTIVWQGWMQPQTFSGQLYEDVQEREFPVMCGLLSLDGEKPVAEQSQGLVNFAGLLYGALQSTGMVFDYIYFSGSDAAYWLLQYVDWENLMEIDDDNNRTSRYTWLEILEAVCRYWGWTCRTQGRNVYMISADENFSPFLIRIDMQGLSEAAGGRTPQWERATSSFIDTDDEIYVSTDNSIELLPGREQVIVTADINAKDVVLDVAFDEIADKFRGGQVTYSKNYDNLYTFRKLTPAGAQFLHDFENASVRLTCYYDQGRTNGFQCIEQWQSPDGTLDGKHNFSWKVSLYCERNGSFDDACLTLTSKSAHAFRNGVITINGDSTSSFTAYLRVGNRCWNGAAWINDTGRHPTFVIRAENGKIADTRELLSNYDAYTGYGIPVDAQGLCGEVEFRITDNEVAVADWLISSLEIGFVAMQTDPMATDNNENIYKASTGMQFNGNENIELIFATNMHNKYGYGLVMSNSGGYMQDAPYTSGSQTTYEVPEQHLLARMLNRYKKIKKKEIIDVNARINIDPITWCETLNMSGYAAAIERHWRDDMERITILET